MRKLACGIAAAVILMAGIEVAAFAQPAPMHHGWDSWWHDSYHQGWDRWWHDWWHSGATSQPGWLHHGCHTLVEKERLPDGQVITRAVKSC